MTSVVPRATGCASAAGTIDTARPTTITQASTENAPIIRLVRDDARVAIAQQRAAPRPPTIATTSGESDSAGAARYRGWAHPATPRRPSMPDATSSTWPGKVSNLTLFAEDLDATRSFYGSVFGLTPIFEDADSSVYRFPNVQVNLLRTTAVPEVIEPAQLAPPDSGVRFLITVDVDDVDAICRNVADQGVTLLNGPIDRPWGVRTASFRDPAGHVWEIAK